MNPYFGVSFSMDTDTEYALGIEYVNVPNVYDTVTVLDPQAVIARSYSGNKRIQSDGLRGVIADSSPIDATVVIVQEHNGILVEVARTVSADGSWSFENLPDAKSHAIAFRETFNAGITSGLQPED